MVASIPVIADRVDPLPGPADFTVHVDCRRRMERNREFASALGDGGKLRGDRSGAWRLPAVRKIRWRTALYLKTALEGVRDAIR